ncbi:DedA family protein [Pantanalinema sp. GBBB05]|uniref:DedA family protein n=1 Tax=Pantanalinema sp. GBBB05 TaxID=2604139 RepID=UPI001DEF45FF|nr:DedA family protein [Pantanalinema sp. GBBB05]
MDFDVTHLVRSFGQLGVWGMVFAESGLLIGVLLPGDSLLFTAGFLASQNLLNIYALVLGAFICAVLGDNVGYATGHRVGRRLFRREDSRFFHKKHLISAQNFYDRHGRKAIVLARFMPVVRTFAPIVAGIGAMNYRIFVAYNIIGGFVWTFGITLLGYFLGQVIPDVDKYLIPIILVIVVVSFAPSIFHLYQERKSTRH